MRGELTGGRGGQGCEWCTNSNPSAATVVNISSGSRYYYYVYRGYWWSWCFSHGISDAWTDRARTVDDQHLIKTYG